MAKNILTYQLAAPLGGAATAQVSVDVGDGNLTIDTLGGGEPLLATGILQYLEHQAPPICAADIHGTQAALTLKAGGKGQHWLRLPWETCNGATLWQIHLNPTVPMDITARTAGGNVRIDLTGAIVSRLHAGTGGGNMDVILPDDIPGLTMTAKTGAGNLNVQLPCGTAAKIHATSGWGKVIIAEQFQQVDKTTYQSPGYDQAAAKIEMTLSSGAGNVKVQERRIAQAVVAHST